MKALVYRGPRKGERRRGPRRGQIEEATDALVRVTSTNICALTYTCTKGAPDARVF
jgi:threonine dehydrogenase-like Zn-dependent dehydrogenase